jgi:hypothetical protein
MMIQPRKVLLCNLFITVILLAGLSWSQTGNQPVAKVSEYHNLLGESIGVSAYDAVAYFPEGGGQPRRGLIRLSLPYKGVTYRFASQENLDRFKANPERYLPEFGGWCAWAVGELGRKVDVDPESFEIRGGRLYLFYRDRELDTRALWQKNPEELLRKATTNWRTLGPGR